MGEYELRNVRRDTKTTGETGRLVPFDKANWPRPLSQSGISVEEPGEDVNGGSGFSGSWYGGR